MVVKGAMFDDGSLKYMGEIGRPTIRPMTVERTAVCIGCGGKGGYTTRTWNRWLKSLVEKWQVCWGCGGSGTVRG